MYLIIKHFHMTLALISIAGFIVRGPLAIGQHRIMQQKWLRIAPHIVDTLLLSAAIYLAWSLSMHPFNSPWIFAKVFALIIYVFLGTMVIKRKGSQGVQWLCYGAAIFTFAYIGMVAVTKSAGLGLLG